MLTGSAPPLARAGRGPAPMNRGLAAPMQAAGDPNSPRGLQAFARRLAAETPSVDDMTGTSKRRWKLITRTESYEAWVIAWPPGGKIDLHDHGESQGAIVTVEGSLSETAVVGGSPGNVDTVSRLIRSGESLYLRRGHIHGVVNAGATTAVSVHVYAPRLTLMTSYTVVDGILTPRESVRCDIGEAIS